MKSRRLQLAGVALMMAAACGQAVAGGGHHGHHGYYGGYGHSHGSSSDGWWIAGALALVAAGTYLAVSSQPSYAPAAQYSAGGITYTTPGGYAASPYDSTVYDPPTAYEDAGYAPAGHGQPAYDDGTVAGYPVAPQGAGIARTATRQPAGEAACRREAMNQSGYDPATPSAWTTGVSVDSYQRALSACLAGRG
ncbi:Uncharacterised protein [Bordetella bronchiseptica]|nr:hypothetical protein [Bordetella bronchiseptica]KDC63522.1 putative lipoprotein [Bordetella bronchiseptica MBORD595]KDC75860.1 putative lipoprotein [Bordetella bronchiseptica MBORD632]VEF41585.1 Uncharacterised protein [Bordetella bronchiseptica]